MHIDTDAMEKVRTKQKYCHPKLGGCSDSYQSAVPVWEFSLSGCILGLVVSTCQLVKSEEMFLNGHIRKLVCDITVRHYGKAEKVSPVGLFNFCSSFADRFI